MTSPTPTPQPDTDDLLDKLTRGARIVVRGDAMSIDEDQCLLASESAQIDVAAIIPGR